MHFISFDCVSNFPHTHTYTIMSSILNEMKAVEMKRCKELTRTLARTLNTLQQDDVAIIEKVSNKVFSQLISDLQIPRSENLELDAYFNGCIADTLRMNAYINTAASDAKVVLPPSANECIMTHVMIKNSKRMQTSLSNKIKAYERQNAMVQVNALVSCRPTPDQEEPITCGVCSDEDIVPAQAVKTGCGHEFCVDCIMEWAKQRGTKAFIKCPCCKAVIDTLTVGDEAEQVKVKAGLAPV